MANTRQSSIKISAGRSEGTCETCLIHSSITAEGGVVAGIRTVYLGRVIPKEAACDPRAIKSTNSGFTLMRSIMTKMKATTPNIQPKIDSHVQGLKKSKLLCESWAVIISLKR